MTVKERKSHQRSLSLCSISEKMSASKDLKSRKEEQNQASTSQDALLKTSLELQRIKGMNVVLTPMGIENGQVQSNINKIFKNARI